jgi:SAM-dependent methyltransferase
VSTVQPEEARHTGQGLRFGEVAELYERRRPGYPAQLFADVLGMVEPPHTVLEVGAGTGKATKLFAAAGATVTAVEPDPAMAEVLRDGHGDLPGLTVVDGTLESVAGGSPPASPHGTGFAVVAAAQAWHWVDQRHGPVLARRLLRPGGVLAVFWNTPRDGAGYEELTDVYRRVAPEMAPAMATTEWSAEMQRRREALIEAEGFTEPETRRYDWAEAYTPDALSELVQTYSGHRLLDPGLLAELTAEVADMVRSLGGRVELGYRTVLFTVRRRD